MKKILFILSFFVSFVSYGQVYQLMPQYGYQTNRMNFDSTLQIPTTCGEPTLKTTYNIKRGAIAFDSCNNRYYYYNPKTTSWSYLGSTSGKVDSVTKSSSTYVDTFKYWINGTSTTYATIDKPDGLISGGDVTQNTQTNFTIKSAIYRIKGVRYTTRDTTITITALPDTPRIDLFVVDTSGKTKYLQGTESQSAAPPNYDRENAIALSFVFVYNDSTFVSEPPKQSYWALITKSRYPNNAMQNTNGGDVVLTNGLWLTNILEGQSDTSTYKPIATDADGNVVRFDNWVSSGGGSTSSLQQVTDVGATTTNAITIDGSGGTLIDFKPLYIDNFLGDYGYGFETAIGVDYYAYPVISTDAYSDSFYIQTYDAGSNSTQRVVGLNNGSGSRFELSSGNTTGAFLSLKSQNASGNHILLESSNTEINDEVINLPIMDGNRDTLATLADVRSGGGVIPPASGYYGAFQDNTTQTAAAINTAYAVKLNTTDLSNGVTIVNNGSGNPTKITLANTGIYNIQFSLQLEKTGGSGNMIVDIWVRKNGLDIPSTTGKVVLTGSSNASPLIAAWNYVLDLTGGDYIELMWSTSNVNVEIIAASAATPHPSIPSAIVTITQQAGIMAGTGITAINSITKSVQTLVIGTSGTDFNISSVDSIHTFNLPTASSTNTGKLSNTDWSTFNNKIGSSDTSVFQRKQIAAYSFQANNTNAAANVTDQAFRDTSGVYSSTITWTGTTAPSGTTNHNYRMVRVGNQVTINIHLNYGTAGSALTAVQMALPSEFPTPSEPSGLGGASEMLYPASGYLNTANSVPSSTPRAALRVNPSDTGYELYIVGGSGNYKTAWISLTYYTN